MLPRRGRRLACPAVAAAHHATARRVQVQLGRASVSTIEVVNGLAEGDRIIVSDTSAWDDHDRLKLK